jgi:molybdopterin synthase catalytic subunit
MIRIVEDHIDVLQLLKSVQAPQAGGIDIFLGTTRNNSGGKKVIRLEYEAYTPMALKLMGKIESEVRTRWQICEFSMIHRIGVVPVADASVGIAVSAPHRKEAFEACRYAIDELKRKVPIWKREVFEDGAMWVENIDARMMEADEYERKRNKGQSEDPL